MLEHEKQIGDTSSRKEKIRERYKGTSPDAVEVIPAIPRADFYIDLIVTKSVSRFARNIVDCIGLVRQLAALHPPVGVFFETERIYTRNGNSKMSLAFIATMAQEEFHTKSSIMNASIAVGDLISARTIKCHNKPSLRMDLHSKKRACIIFVSGGALQ